jgi:hypothetical protein
VYGQGREQNPMGWSIKLATSMRHELCARLAKLEKYKISEYPLVKDSWTKLIEEISNEDSNTEDILLKKYFKSWYPAVTYFKQLDQDYFKPKMLMPFQLLLK